MRLELSRLVLVKRYLWGSLAVAIIPLVLLAVMYDRYSSNLLSNLLTEKVDGELEATAVKMVGFIDTQTKRIDNIVDLPAISEVFSKKQGEPLSTKLTDLLYFEIGDPDIYGIEFFDESGKCIRAIPAPSQLIKPVKPENLPVYKFGDHEILGPYIPEDGRPGWFLIRKDVTRDGHKVGAMAFKARLSSLTEYASAMSRRGVYEPLVSVNNKEFFSVVGTKAYRSGELIKTREILPGWNIALVQSGNTIEEPKKQIRYLLLVIAILSGIAVVYLFVHMSERLARMITPLNEGAQAIAQGDFSVKVSETAPGELRTLARSFNEMSTHLNSLISSRVDMERRAALGNFAAGIAHEIRNPLTTIRTSIHGLKRLDQDPSRQNIMEVMIEEIIRVDAIVSEFLEYARPREPRKEPTKVCFLFNSIEALTRGTLQEANIKLVKTGDSSIELDVDPAQLRQILMNVILNAIQSMPDGGYLTLRSRKVDDYAEIEVEDTGAGISEEELSKVLIPFYTTKPKGTGLGLSICNQLAHANGGELIIESSIGKGTIVCIKVPIVKMAKEVEEREEESVGV